MVNIRFTLHSKEKLSRLVKIGVTGEKVMETINNPEKRLNGYLGRRIEDSAKFFN